jgi:hypothetical protein
MITVIKNFLLKKCVFIVTYYVEAKGKNITFKTCTNPFIILGSCDRASLM